MSTTRKAYHSPDWEQEYEFEHIPWDEIVEAELQGDMEKLRSLKNRSSDIKYSRSCSKPYSSSFVSPIVPSNTPLSGGRPFQEFDDEYPCLPSTASNTPSIETSLQPVSYANALGPRVAKRTMDDRTCLSPIDYLPKRSAYYNTGTDRVGPSTYLSPTSTRYKEDGMEIEATPDNDSRPNKAAIAAQRRLFPPKKENMEPILTTKVLHPESRPRSSSVSSAGSREGLSEHQITQRQKQIDFGKNTLGYQRYIQTVPRWKRGHGDPRTPDKAKSCSTRAWQGQIRVWRRALHKYDPPSESNSQFTAEEAALCHMEFHKE